MPERASKGLKCTVTLPLYQPAALGLVVAAALRVGLVKSMLMPETVVPALLPATSVAVPLTDWPAPSPLSVVGPETPARPERASLALKLTVTGPLFQPKPLAAGARAPLIDGGVASIRMDRELELGLVPLLSVAVAVIL